MPRLLAIPRLLLRRSTLLSLPVAALIALVPIGAAPGDAPVAEVQQAVRAVTPIAPAPDILPFSVLPEARLAVQTKATPPELLTGYRWPLPRGRITLPFGPTQWGSRVVDGELFHDGLDLATFCGDRIVAAHDGVVIAAGRHFDHFIGWVGSLDGYFRRLDRKHLWRTLPIMVVIDDGNTYRSMYAHFGRIVVHSGQLVRAGQLLGYEGATGHATGCHLHYGLYSPLESAKFGLERGVAQRMKLPKAEIARIDPLLVLPERKTSKPATPDKSIGHDSGG